MLELLAASPVPRGKTADRRAERFAEVDENGRLVLPDAVREKLGFKPGESVYFELGENTVRIHRAFSLPARIYVEPTTRCNMDCAMCQRQTWSEGTGDMDPVLFERILELLETCDPVPTVVFGGFGEPLMHPHLIDFMAACKKRGAGVELITNGLLLTDARLDRLADMSLDRLWLSIDGISDYCGGHIRSRNAFDQLIARLKPFTANRYSGASQIHIGFVFVAMKDNIREFPKVMDLARLLNVDRLLVSNLLPYTREGLDQTLYPRSTWKMNERVFQVRLPRFDVKGEALGIILEALAEQDMTDFLSRPYNDPLETCPFVRKGSLTVGWDGRISPCPPLLHSHSCFFQRVERKNRECSFGNLHEGKLIDIWNAPAYLDFRKRVAVFDFSPCVSCASCEWSESNETDCFGNEFPTCGGCLWAQGLIQCP